MAKKGVSLVCGLPFGSDVISGPVVDRVDLIEVDKVGDLDQLGFLGLRRVEFMIGQQDVLPTTEVVPFDDLRRGNLDAGAFIDLLLPDPVRCPLFKLVEVDRLVLCGRVEADRDIHQAEVERTLPNGSSHVPIITQVRPHPPPLLQPLVTLRL